MENNAIFYGGNTVDHFSFLISFGIATIKDSIVFHAGTTLKGQDILTNGGRVLALTSFGINFQDALAISKANAEKIQFDKKYFRTDIGFDL